MPPSQAPAHLRDAKSPSFDTKDYPFDDNRSWALWGLRELKRLGVHHAIAPQAHALVAHGYLTEDDIAGLLDELRGGPLYKPTPPKQLNLLIEETPCPG